MRAAFLLGLILAQLLWWDILDKVRIAVSWNWARSCVDREMPHRATRLFALARFTVGLVFRPELMVDEIPDRFVVLSNHQSVIDIVAIMAAFRRRSVRFVAKRELRHWFPAVSRVLRIQRHALISRHGDFSLAMKEIESLGRTLRHREGAVIFPEGTRSRDGVVRTFHSGAVRRLLTARPLPVVVVAVDGGWNVAGLADLGRMDRGHRFRLRVLKVLPPASEKRELVQQIATAQQLIEDTLAQWRGAE